MHQLNGHWLLQMKSELTKLRASGRNDKRQTQKLQLELVQAKQLLGKLQSQAKVSCEDLLSDVQPALLHQAKLDRSFSNVQPDQKARPTRDQVQLLLTVLSDMAAQQIYDGMPELDATV